MTSQEYKKLLAEMRKELESLLEQQEDIEQKIAQLKQAIISFAPLAKEPESTTFGLLGLLASEFIAQGMTESIREILRAVFPKQLSPVEIKEQLKSRGQNLSQHKNVMASIHSTLKRMLENKEISTSDDGLTYGWRRRYRFPIRTPYKPPTPLTG